LQNKKSAVSSRHERRKYHQQAALDPLREPTADELAAVDVEKLISEDHPARAIWTLVGRLDLSPFYRAIESSVEEGGRPAFDPQLLISLWV
jgi:hypothetical protein